MAKGQDGSVAPRERINIVYKSDTGDQKEDVELPFRFLVVGDFTGKESDGPIEERAPVGVDKDNFDAVMEAHDVSVDLGVPNELSEDEGDEIGVSLKFKRMRDFSPDSVCQQVPELKKLVDLRDALTALKGPLGNTPAFRKRLQAILDDPSQQKQLMEELGVGKDDK